MTAESHHPDVQIIKASHALQKRVGNGPIDPGIVERCQNIMNGNTVDFVPIATKFLDMLELELTRTRFMPGSARDRLMLISRPVMELKANAKTFHYELITGLTGIMLAFLEAIPDIDEDAFEMISLHHRTLQTILARRLTGDGGPYGRLLQQELLSACNRYCVRRGIRPLSFSLI